MDKKIIAVTGGIATGKTAFCAVLKKRGFPVINLDDINRTLLKKTEIISVLAKTFGKKIKRGRGINRKVLAELVFSDIEKRKKLESIMHPLILEEMNAAIAAEKQNIVFVEVPLLFETGWNKQFDIILTVYAPRKTQLSRLLKAGFSRKDAESRIASQMDIEEKKELSDFVVQNTSTQKVLEKEAERFLLYMNSSRRPA